MTAQNTDATYRQPSQCSLSPSCSHLSVNQVRPSWAALTGADADTGRVIQLGNVGSPGALSSRIDAAAQ